MFWGCFCYYRVGPSYCWPVQSKEMKKKYDAMMKRYNDRMEAVAKIRWEINEEIRRSKLRYPNKGKKPVWKFTAQRGAQTRANKSGGIDWIRYREEVLKPLFIPFITQLKKDYPNVPFITQKNNAPSHTSRWYKKKWEKAGIKTLIWPSNSPNLSAIKPPWFQIKKNTIDGFRSQKRQMLKPT